MSDIAYLRSTEGLGGRLVGTVAVREAGGDAVEAPGVPFLQGAGARAPLTPAPTWIPKNF